MGGNRLLASLISGSALPIKKHGVSGLVSGGNGAGGYDSGLGSDGNWLTVSNLTTNDDVASPSGLGDKSWLSDGSDTIISTDAGQIFPVDSDLTFICWIYPTTLKAQNVINSDADNLFVLYGQSANMTDFEFKCKDGLGNQSGGEASYAFEADTWYMVAGTFEASTGKTISYVFNATSGSGGALKTVATSDVESVATNTDWKMMGAGSETFAGRVLSPCIWNVELSSSELDDLFADGDGVTPDTVQKDKIVCYWDSQTGSAPIENLAIP